jgi:glycine cleavage system aminomethyltransferase T
VPCNYDGYVIGDVILFYLDKDLFNIVGRPSVHNWVQYNGEIGKYNVKFERDERAAAQKGPIVRKAYRYQVQGPNAMKVIEKVTGKPAPELKFFHMTSITIAGKKVRALRHGMAGQPGLELFGPWEDAEAVKAAIAEAGKEFGLRLVGARVGVDSFADASDLFRGKIEGLPAMAASERLRSYRVARRKLLFEQHRRLLSDALGFGLRADREVRS